MNDAAIPDVVRRLLRECLRSLMALELVLLLGQAAGDLTAAELARELRVDGPWTEKELERLRDCGLMIVVDGQPPRFRLNREAPGLVEALTWLNAWYPQRRFSIIQLIYSAPDDPLRNFADAFKLRKDPQDG